MKHLLMSALLSAALLNTNSLLANASVTQMSQVAAAEARAKVNLNQANVEQLAAVPGLGRVKAQAIVDYVREHGAIKSESDLTKVKGIGEKLAARVAQHVSFD